MGAANEASRVYRPKAGKIWSKAFADTTAVVYEVPAIWKGQYVTFTVSGGAMQIAVSDSSSITLTKDAESTGSPPTLTVNTATGQEVSADTSKDIIFLGTDTHFAVVGAAAGQWWATPSGIPVP